MSGKKNVDRCSPPALDAFEAFVEELKRVEGIDKNKIEVAEKCLDQLKVIINGLKEDIITECQKDSNVQLGR